MSVVDVIKQAKCYGSREVGKNRLLARALRGAGYSCEESSKGFDISGEKFAVECKMTLSTPETDRFFHQLERNIKDHLDGRMLIIVFWGDVKQSTLVELKSKLNGMWTPWDIVVKGEIRSHAN